MGHQWSSALPGHASERKTEITIGDSFGEEIILGLEDCYRYAIVASTDIVAYLIPESGFVESFTNMPDIIEQMRRNYNEMNSQQSELSRPKLPRHEMMIDNVGDEIPDTIRGKLRYIGD